MNDKLRKATEMIANDIDRTAIKAYLESILPSLPPDDSATVAIRLILAKDRIYGGDCDTLAYALDFLTEITQTRRR